MKISPLNKYYFDKSYIVDKHDPNHDNRRILHTLISKIWWFWTLNSPSAKKQPFLLVFSVTHVYNVILDWPTGDLATRMSQVQIPLKSLLSLSLMMLAMIITWPYIIGLGQLHNEVWWFHTQRSQKLFNSLISTVLPLYTFGYGC